MRTKQVDKWKLWELQWVGSSSYCFLLPRKIPYLANMVVTVVILLSQQLPGNLLRWLGKEEGPVRADMVLIQPFPLLTSAFPPCSMPLLSRLSSESGKCFPPWAGPWLSVASLSIFFWIPGGLVGLDSHSTKLSISEVWPFDADCGLK